MSQKQNDDQFSDKLGSLLSDPEMMQKIVQMAAAMKQNEEAHGESDNNGSAEAARASDNKTTFDEEAPLKDEAPSAPVSAPPLPPLPSLHHHDANTEL